MTAVDMNLIRDNLLYLHGDAGAVSINDTIIQAGTTSASVEAQATTAGSNARLRLLAKRTAGSAVVDWRIFVNALSDAGEFSIYDAIAAAERMRIDNAGNVGFGTASPQSKLHVGGAGGGFLYLSAAAVTTLQTLAVAGTVTAAALFFIIDRNNTTPFANYLASGGIMLTLGSGGITYVNTDTLKVDLTAGGAITVARTVGTNGTHDVNMIVIYR